MITTACHTQKQMTDALEQFDLPYECYSEIEILELAVSFIAEEQIIGWFQDGRNLVLALGNRSILANPTSHNTKYILDHFMKCRDRYRPYAPVVVEEKQINILILIAARQ